MLRVVIKCFLFTVKSVSKDYENQQEPHFGSIGCCIGRHVRTKHIRPYAL